MHSLISLLPPLGQVANSWLTVWLTPVWYLAAGLALGMIGLALCIGLFRLLSLTPWSRLSTGPVGHVVAAVISGLVAFGIFWWVPTAAWGDESLQEPLLVKTAVGLLCAIVGWSIVFCSGRRAAANAMSVLTEGAAGYIGTVALIVVAIGGVVWLAGVAFFPIVDNPLGALQSIPAVFTAGEQPDILINLEARPNEGEAPFVELDMPIDFALVSQFKLSANTTIILGDAAEPVDFSRAPFRLAANESIDWNRFQPLSDLPIAYEPGTAVYAQNQEIEPATIRVEYYTFPPVPQAVSLLATTIATMLAGLALLLQNAVAPRVSAVSLATIKNELGQPLFLVLMSLGAVLILLYEFLSFNTFGEDIKLLKDCGITTIMLLAAFQGVWSASSSVSEEIEGRTALTVLSKPIQRRSFVIGKFMGLFWVLALMFFVLGIMLLIAVAYKPIYDAKEASLDMPMWQICHAEMMQTVPGLAMGFMQAILLTAVSVALATRLPMLANISICFAIYLIGNLTTSIVSSTVGQFAIVEFIAQLIATIIPILEHFQLQAAIDADRPITMSLLSGNLIYCLLYVLLAMFLALLLFEDRDLA
jgi:ABC-type transport system involved in multi-copper enzyme maturation permease subunit